MYKRTILIVDDQEINRRILGKLLSNEYETLYATNGMEAMICLREHIDIISAVLLDIVMPVMDGYEVLREMHDDPKISNIPVIVSSQKDGEENEIKALSLGAQDFIAKPYKADIIRHRLANIIKLRETAAIINSTEKDELTGLYNKQFFLKKLQNLLHDNPKNRYDLLCVGIERFKLINDTFGMQGGDRVLIHIGKVIQKACEQLGICGRFDSDLFYAVLPHRESYTNNCFKPWIDQINSYPIDIDIKIHCGIYVIDDTDMAVASMCDRAQLASNKNRGKYDEYFYMYDDSLRKKLIEEQFFISHMQTAIDNGEFKVYYQPKYDLTTEMVAGAEALVRWIHPEKGFISPGEFIPIFEKNGYITLLDQFVWETACKDIRSWMDKGYSPVAVSVNVSRADIYNPRFTDIILGLVAKYKIPIKYLHLEITESAYTENPAQIISVVGRLRNLGFSIEMDDFGSGYSSLNMLADMPVDVLKLDIGFIQSETRNTSGKGILSFVISLAKWLNLAVVAEGVETKEQIVSLRSMDCNYVQGYYYSKPVDEPTFQVIIRDSQTTEMVCTSRNAVEFVQTRKQGEPLKHDRVMLIVDDIEINRASLAATFLDEYVIAECENGAEAWEYLMEKHDLVDIIMTDLLMPVMDGFQLLEKIRKDERTRDIPVIVTSQGDADTERRILEMEADDFISKPYNPEIIKHRVANVLDSHELRCYRDKMEVEALKQNDDLNIEKLSGDAGILRDIEKRRAYFDIVRMVDPIETYVFEGSDGMGCDMHSCFSVWEKTGRCNNCISLMAFEKREIESKLEYSKDGLFCVISQYVPYGDSGAVVEMVKKLDDRYIDNVFDKELLHSNIEETNDNDVIDESSGVYNTDYMENYMHKYLSSVRKKNGDFGLAIVNIDNYKDFNKIFGPESGNEMLRQVAQIIESNIAVSKGDFVSRFEESSFVIVCLNIGSEVFEKRISAVTEIIEHIKFRDQIDMKIMISTGCVNFSEFMDADEEELVNIARERLEESRID